jgi:hypothetical protein
MRLLAEFNLGEDHVKPVNQSICDKNRGDCHRAVIASLLDLEIEQVPHFRLFADDNWHHVYHGFLWGCGYEWEGTGHFPKFTPRSEHLKDCHIGGFVDATVPSKNYPPESGITHAVVMDLDGLVVHDPHPGKKYQGVNVIETGELMHWELIKPRGDRS